MSTFVAGLYMSSSSSHVSRALPLDYASSDHPRKSKVRKGRGLGDCKPRPCHEQALRRLYSLDVVAITYQLSASTDYLTSTTVKRRRYVILMITARQSRFDPACCCGLVLAAAPATR
eukprot:6210400-Pleurochrysis_carterae.AAC.5